MCCWISLLIVGAARTGRGLRPFVSECNTQHRSNLIISPSDTPYNIHLSLPTTSPATSKTVQNLRTIIPGDAFRQSTTIRHASQTIFIPLPPKTGVPRSGASTTVLHKTTISTSSHRIHRHTYSARSLRGGIKSRRQCT